MPWVVTPKQLQGRSEFYHQFGTLLAAGVPLLQALETLRRTASSKSNSEPIHRAILVVNQGYNLTEALIQSHRRIPSFDIALIAAGEKSGRLEQCLKLLAEFYRMSALLARQVWSQCLYPAVLVHTAIFLAPITVLVVKGDVWGYLASVLAALVPVYGVVLFLVWIFQGSHRERWQRILEKLFDIIPFFGPARRDLSISRLALSLEALINAGVPVLQSWPIASLASGSHRLREAATAWLPQAEHHGIPPGELLLNRREYPDMFSSLYLTGEKSGSLDESLRRLHTHYLEEGVRKMKLAAEWAPRILYFGIMIVIAFRVVRFYSDYFGQINKAMGP